MEYGLVDKDKTVYTYNTKTKQSILSCAKCLIITRKDLMASKIPKSTLTRQLSRMVLSGELVKLERGVYIVR